MKNDGEACSCKAVYGQRRFRFRGIGRAEAKSSSLIYKLLILRVSQIIKTKSAKMMKKNIVSADFVFIICGNAILGYIYGENCD